MGQLYHPERFEPLTETPWDEGRVRDAIGAIVDDVGQAYRGEDRLWPADPMPYHERWNLTDPLKSLYEGAAGTVYALHDLRQRGHADSGLDLAAVASRAVELFESQPDFGDTLFSVPDPRDAALLTGETGILLLAWRLAPSDDLVERLERRVRENADNDADEVMWGTPGTLFAATAMLRSTGDERWRDAARQSAEALLRRRGPDGLWVQHIYGEEVRRLDSIHGTAGNVLALSRWLEGEPRRAFEGEAAALFARLAVVEDGLANWPAVVGESPGLLRWCAGAPGIITATAAYLDMDLLLAAAELVWRAGAPRTATGPGICCGTAGNGYALLKVFERTGDERWLDRARRFAVHALEQVERDRARGGPGWYSLWKGDPGVATYAADCLDGRPRYPVLGDLRSARAHPRSSGQRSAPCPAASAAQLPIAQVHGPPRTSSACPSTSRSRRSRRRVPGPRPPAGRGPPAPDRSASLPGPGFVIVSPSSSALRHFGVVVVSPPDHAMRVFG